MKINRDESKHPALSSPLLRFLYRKNTHIENRMKEPRESILRRFQSLPYSYPYQDEKIVCRGERELLKAMVFRAVQDLRPDTTPEFNRSSKVWFKSSSTQPFSFLWVCDILGWNARKIKKVLFNENLLY